MRRRDFIGNALSIPAIAVGSGAIAKGMLAMEPKPPDPIGRSGNQLPAMRQQDGLVTIENGLIRRSIELGQNGWLKLRSLRNLRTDFDWAAPNTAADIYFEIGETMMTGFEPGHGFQFGNPHKQTLKNGALELSIGAIRGAIKVTLLYTIFPGCSVLEHQLIIENVGDKPLPPIRRFDPLTLWLQDNPEALNVYSLANSNGGPAGIVTPRPLESMTLQRHRLESAFAITGVDGTTPWFVLENTQRHEFLFTGIGWTTDWGLRLLRKEDRILLTSGILKSATELEPGQRLESPRIFVGLTHGNLDTAVNQMHEYLGRFVLPTFPKNYPWVTYNLWFTEPGDMEAPLKREADFAADLGVECFYHDASWYKGADTQGSGLWGQGLGNYKDMESRFPHGLRNLSDYVHSKGMKFGIWVDPPNVASALVGKQVSEKWVARHDGVDWVLHVSVWKPDPGLKRLCLGCPEVVEYLKEQLSDVVRKWNIDWLKWDPSGSSPFQQVCDRSDHGHQHGNGAYAAVRGEEQIRRYLLQKFPTLVIEYCPGGPDEMAPWSRNFPVSYGECPGFETYKIRHRVIGASYWFPGGLGQSYLWDRPDPIANRPDLKPLGFLTKPHDDPYLDNLFRSYSMTGLGFGTLDGSISQGISRWHPTVIRAARRNIHNFKRYRHLLLGRVHHLAPQTSLYIPDEGDSKQWDVLEYVNKEGSEAVVFFFRGGAEQVKFHTSIRDLHSNASYTLTSLNTDQEHKLSGSVLRDRGVEVRLPAKDTSEICLLRQV